jgi:hypothetical protein
MAMGEPARKYWFPAKRYGWGWGPPVAWQGWAVLIVWTAAFTAGVSLLLPTRRPVLYGLFVAAMIGVVLAICYAKGEPPRWRWGNKDDGPR